MCRSLRASIRARVSPPVCCTRVHAAALALLLAIWAVPAAAQTDFLNTDGGRPLHVQDAMSVDWRAFELQFAPLSIERHRESQWLVSIEPELAFGLWPRTHVSIGLPLVSLPKPSPAVFQLFGRSAGQARLSRSASIPARDVIIDPSVPSAGQTGGLAGVHLSVFHQLNVETRIPALAVRGAVLLPAGPFGPARAIPSIMGIVTRTLPALGAVRVHGNASVAFGDAPETLGVGQFAAEEPRWMAGVSMDRAFPLQSTLIAVEAVAEQGMRADDVVRWRSGVGVRHQFSPRVVLDLGFGRQLTGADSHWSFTAGSAIELGLGRRIF